MPQSFGTEIKDTVSRVKKSVPERLRYGTVEEVSQTPQLMITGNARRILPFYPAYIKGEKGCNRGR